MQLHHISMKRRYGEEREEQDRRLYSEVRDSKEWKSLEPGLRMIVVGRSGVFDDTNMP